MFDFLKKKEDGVLPKVKIKKSEDLIIKTVGTTMAEEN